MKREMTLVILLSILLASCMSYPERIKAYTTGNPGKPFRVLGSAEATYIPQGYSKKVAPGLKSYERNYEKYGDTKTHVSSYNLEAPPDLKPDYQEANRLMLIMAYRQYGSILAAVVNVRYSTSKEYYAEGGKVDTNLQRMRVKASGTAVCFIDRQNKCIAYDDDSVIEEESTAVASIPKEKPVAMNDSPGEKLLVSRNILGSDLLSTKTDTDTKRHSKGFKKGYFYDYDLFSIRIMEFKTPKIAKSYLESLGKKPNAKRVNEGFYWLSQQDSEQTSYLVYLLDPTKVVAIYPADKSLSTAAKISAELEKK
ncbi:MAG: hypothetical protein WC663_02820 [Patescibacteria group bacterium]|jgi:hypothetical protein